MSQLQPYLLTELNVLDSLNSKQNSHKRENDIVIKTKALKGLLPLQCYNHCRGQLNIHPQKCHQGGDTSNCILEDPWVA